MKPQTYKDWRRLYSTELRWLGCNCHWYATTRLPFRKPAAFREMQYSIRRISRIQNRMSAEVGAMTESYVDAVVEAVTGKKRGV